MYVDQAVEKDALIARNRDTVERFLAGTHSHNIEDVAVIDDTVGGDIVCHGFPGITITDHESYKMFFRVFRDSFSNMEFAVDALVADENFVSARWRISCLHTGAFAGVEPTGKRVNFDGMVLYRMADGLIVETWLHIDQLSLLSQIGAVQPPAA